MAAPETYVIRRKNGKVIREGTDLRYNTMPVRRQTAQGLSTSIRSL
ncbi:hypothetical protein [Rhodanobacter denitrificans]|uniref:Uncharacterized protein n=1 Tax=Rhodanobacter denitrificans TaxID=666685 RepID=M4NFY0_9GAMM|nr:hypothetical protein [Rhodanobacter denitrificans]AGG88543.1 hypothetical protein R2APBS1_1392 [Rhodanobacter denitrificans]UJJ58789.1 hypothetical protein LRK55_01250 [Rhodanobacter denitrificans]UJM87678.1 hypothetical protein LRJ86_05040 [Rhodanobacter denitrificans]